MRIPSFLALIGFVGCHSHSADVPDASKPNASGIGSGVPLWYDSDPTDPYLDTLVDIGSMHSIGSANVIEVMLRWPTAPGTLMDWQAMHPDVKLPVGTTMLDRERVECTPSGTLSYSIEERLMAPGDRELTRETYDPATKRAEAQKVEDTFRATLHDRARFYAPNPVSLACLAAASRCRGEPFTWPPPPNNAPLEYSARATQMKADYDAPFVPSCLF